MNVLGLNAFHGDSAACLVRAGKICCAAEEERFRRIKHWAGFPTKAIEFCLQQQSLTLADIDIIAINTDPSAARWAKLWYLFSSRPSLKLIQEKLAVRGQRAGLLELLSQEIPTQRFAGKIEYVEHHLAHLSSAFHCSAFNESSVVSIDGFGDFASAAWGLGKGGELGIDQRVHFPHSLGIFYQALTQYLGFPHYGDEYKVMGLASYGEVKYARQMDSIISSFDDGSFELDLEFFVHHKQPLGYRWEGGQPQSGQLYSDALCSLLGPARQPTDKLEQRHMDIARSVQDAYERTFFKLLNKLHSEHKQARLCLAGGCAMNSVANGKIHLNTPYQEVYVQPAAGDAGGAIGAALIASARAGSTLSASLSHAYLGNDYSDQELSDFVAQHDSQLQRQGCSIHRNVALDELIDSVIERLCAGAVVGWFQGAMEWGPRALGNRSILGDPRRSDMQEILNHKIKRRESFRPFAPSVLKEQVADWFESDLDVPFMMKVLPIKASKQAQIPAVTHIDGSGRLQTVTAQSNPRYHQLISAFFAKTGVPMLLNTSFNENEPVVRQPEEAMDCFLRTQMDVLVLGRCLILRGDAHAH